MVSAFDFYKVDIVIVGGDMTGKAVVPIVRHDDETFTSTFLGRNWTLKNSREVDEQKKLIVDAGMYIFECRPEELDSLKGKGDRVDAIFKEKVIERIREWLTIADVTLKPKNKRIIVAPGNDDADYVEEVLRESDVVVNAEGRVLDLDGRHEMLNSGWSNPTPWHTPRECSEDELKEKIEAMASQIKNLEQSIFNLHVPPFGSGLDTAPKLTENLEIDPKGTSEVGSTAVLAAIKKYQPVLGLHGHIHEVTAERRIGKSLCVNPGSHYTEGILNGVVVTLDDKKIKSTMFTTG
jgi:Icc-related predicted phosphoesterase